MGISQSKASISPMIYKAGASAAALSVLIYILFGPKQTKSFLFTAKQYKILGLHNFGQTCYLNAVLQAIAACDYFVHWIERRNRLNKLTAEADASRNGTFLTRTGEPATPFVVYSKAIYPIVAVLHKTFQVINRDVQADDDLMSQVIPGEVFQIFNSGSVQMLSRHEEQDAHEIFNIITGSLYKSQKTQKADQFLSAVNSLLEPDDSSQEPVPKSESKNDSASSETSETEPDGDWKIISRNTTARVKKSVGGMGAGGDTNPEVTSNISASANFLARSDRRVIREDLITDLKWTEGAAPVTGLLASQLQCISCLHKSSINCEAFSSITLILSPPKYIYPTLPSVQDLLESYLKSTLVHDVDCFSCAKKKKEEIPIKTTFYKRNCLARFPNTLVLHIHRTEYQANGLNNKRLDYVKFETVLDLSTIDSLSDLITGNTKKGVNNPSGTPEPSLTDTLRWRNTQYQLRSVICHRGDANSGHFITYRRESRNDQQQGWFMVSDMTIYPVTVQTVLQSDAYMLFYEKTDFAINY